MTDVLSQIPLPSGWASSPLWSHFRRRKRTGYGHEELLSVYRDHGVIPRDSRDDNFNKASDDLSAYQLVEVGDLVVNKMKAWQGSLGVSAHRGIVSPAYFVYVPKSDLDSRFAHYLLRSQPYASWYRAISKGIRPSQWDLIPEDFGSVPVLTPPLDEQRAIADFLDRETAQIDAMVDAQERLVALLEERRSAVVANAVTVGLDPDVTMQDSGVDWLGNIPNSWVTVPTRYVCDISTGDKDTVDAEPDGEYPLFVRSPVVERISEFTHDGEAVLTAGDGAGVGSVFHHFTGKFAAHQRVYVYMNFRRALPRYFYWYLSEMLSRVTLAGTAKSTVPSLRRPMLGDLVVTIPPLSEQLRIVEYLDITTARIDAMIAKVEESIALMKERRAALISAAVTGRIDVRTGNEHVERELEEAMA